jgi:hypothetical protein
MRAVMAAVLLVALAGCASSHLNGSDKLPPAEQSILWLHQDQLTMFRVLDLNGQKLRQEWLTKLVDVPGPKNLALEAYFTYERGEQKNNKIRFAFAFTAKPGHSYNLRLVDGSYRYVTNATRLCLLEEPHGAPGSSVNYTGEFRQPSKDAVTLGCSAPEIVAGQP